MAEGILSIVAEMDARAAADTACARDADELECLMQAREHAASAQVSEWVSSTAAAVTTETGKALARLALEPDPADWSREVATLHQGRD
jgi:putative hydrolases of HD superfamily